MSNNTFISIISAVSASIGAALGGIVLLPVDDVYKAFAVFFLSVVGTFFSALIKPPTGPQVAKTTRSRNARK